jgi:2-succinyl-6-hydroxy-2,4-cyclohexadiene-1-carboxylate synthase
MLLDLNGVSYAVEVAGALADVPPVLLLHGFTGAAANWSPVLGGLQAQTQVIAPDLLGHGHTAAPDDPARYAMPLAAADLFALWQRLDLPPVHLVGYSMGGRLAVYTALAYPQMLARLTLESASPGLDDEAERAARRAADDALADRIEREGIAAFAAFWEQLPLFATQSAEAQTSLRAVRLAQRPHGLANSLRGMGTGVQPPLWSRLSALTMPVQLLVGALDAKFTAINQQMQARIPGARLTVVPAAGHTVHLEQPTAWLAALASRAGTDP